jgi:adenine-specific DNA-methyltransferase
MGRSLRKPSARQASVSQAISPSRKNTCPGKRYLAYQHESAYLLIKGRPLQPSYAISDVIAWNDFPRNELHPTQKPISVLTPLIEAFSQRQETVLDPFAGSGSTLLAAKMLGRNWLGAELDEKYHATALKRLAGEANAA